MHDSEKAALLPVVNGDHYDARAEAAKARRRSYAFALILAILLVLSVWPIDDDDNSGVSFSRRRHHHHKHHDDTHKKKKHNSATCPTQPPALNVGHDWVPNDEAAYVELAVQRLQGAIQIPTESYDDMGPPESEPRFAGVAKFGEYLERTFPLVHGALSLEKVAVHGRVYTWAGEDSSLKPIVLMAHQDGGTYEPFSGHRDSEGWIWGRGGTDCKNTVRLQESSGVPRGQALTLKCYAKLIGMLAAIEQLVGEDFKPARTIILSFGFDEEIGGPRSARPLAEHLLSRYGQDGVAFIVDEGFTGVDEAYNATFARFGLAEKGAVNLALSVLTPGGHSSAPQKHTGIGALAKLLVALEDEPAPVKLDGNPLLSYLTCAAKYGEVDKKLARKVRDPKKWSKLAHELAEGDDVTRAFLGTTQAIDLINGGIKINALPEYTKALINYRIDFHSSVNATFHRIANLLAPVVAQLNLTFSVAGDHKDVKNSVVRLDVVEGSQIEPAPITPSEGPVWNLMAGTTKAIWADAIAVPSGMVANTDTKWTWDLTKHIYRFAPASLELMKGTHTVDERIHVDAHLTTIRWYYKLLRNTEGWQDA